MIRQVDHIELEVNNLEDMASMFNKMGFEEISRTSHHGGSVNVKLPGENQVIFEIHEVPRENNPDINHIAFLCDDIHKTQEDLIEKGFTFEKGPNNEDPPYLIEASGRTISCFRDTDGRRMQLVDLKKIEAKEGSLTH